jgi:predicted regulator of Ras-like GTPase activity (Roadblock/LC7/MglB family)
LKTPQNYGAICSDLIDDSNVTCHNYSIVCFFIGVYPMTHHVFLSYSRQDVLIMQRVRDDLRERGLSVWTDENLEPGTPSWKSAIQTAIENAGSLVALLSPEAKQSPWVDRELEYARVQNVRIFPVLIRGSDSDSVPFEVVATQRINISKPSDYEAGIDQLYDTLAKYLGIRLMPKANDVERALLVLGEKLAGVKQIGLVNLNGMLIAAVDCVSREAGNELFSKQLAAMSATLVNLSDKIHQRMSLNEVRYVVSGSQQEAMIAIYFDRRVLVLLFNSIISVDSSLLMIQRSIQPLLDVLEVKTEIKF